MAPLCSGLARRPLKAVAPVRIRSGLQHRNPSDLQEHWRGTLVSRAGPSRCASGPRVVGKWPRERRAGSPLVPRRGFCFLPKVFLTGSSGGVGAHSARPALEAGGWAVEPFDLTDGKDLRDEAAVLHAMEGCEAVVHAGGIAHDSTGTPPRSSQLTFWARGTFCKPPKLLGLPRPPRRHESSPGGRRSRRFRTPFRTRNPRRPGWTHSGLQADPSSRQKTRLSCVLSSCRRRNESDPLRSRPERHRR
jgi:hypothetical protein